MWSEPYDTLYARNPNRSLVTVPDSTIDGISSIGAKVSSLRAVKTSSYLAISDHISHFFVHKATDIRPIKCWYLNQFKYAGIFKSLIYLKNLFFIRYESDQSATISRDLWTLHILGKLLTIVSLHFLTCKFINLLYGSWNKKVLF